MGCDLNILIKCFTCSDFNPRTHRGVRHDLKLYPGNNIIISIHAPIVGCDEDYLVLCRIPQISIHAPIVGCDDAEALRVTADADNFNPRTHRGVRPVALVKSLFSPSKFQSTHPSWGATKSLIEPFSARSEYFNPRTHRGVRHNCY